tara:strand:+ start:1107 stop:1739 length:633 start_codon:yes stop_codon:yes gene_type:complete
MTDINDKLIGALIKAQSEMTFASKTGTNPHFKSGYAPLETVIDAVKNPLNDNGIFYLQKVYLAEGGQCVETEFHGHGGVIKAGRVYVPADKQTPQGYGSALTYAKRYSLITACGLPSEDDDGNSAESNYKAKPKAKPKAEPKQNKQDDSEANVLYEALSMGVSGSNSIDSLKENWIANQDAIKKLENSNLDVYNKLIKLKDDKKKELENV